VKVYSDYVASGVRFVVAFAAKLCILNHLSRARVRVATLRRTNRHLYGLFLKIAETDTDGGRHINKWRRSAERQNFYLKVEVTVFDAMAGQACAITALTSQLDRHLLSCCVFITLRSCLAVFNELANIVGRECYLLGGF